MKVIIAGSRGANITKEEIAEALTKEGFKPTEIVSGGSGNVDLTGEDLGYALGIPVKVFKADWKAHGLSAGPRRNYEMAQYADALIAFWDGKSRGTSNMINQMYLLGKPARTVNI